MLENPIRPANELATVLPIILQVVKKNWSKPGKRKAGSASDSKFYAVEFDTAKYLSRPIKSRVLNLQ